MTFHAFPKDFVWGTATASFQIEGGGFEDGRMPSIWDTFCNRPGAIADGSNGLVADDHYHRYDSDVALMAELGVNAYRFSIAWPRILPEGTGRVNEKGLDFYKRLLDSLEKRGITPYATLYHWDLPQLLSDRGGWTQRFIADAFTGYADVVSRALGDRVKHWITLNEPSVSAWVGYLMAHHAPGIAHLESAVRVAHYLLLAHGKAVPVIRANCAGAQVGLTFAMGWNHPATDSSADQAAAEREHDFWNGWFADPALKGHYPQAMFESFGGEKVVPVQPGDLEIISAPLDFMGVNYYTRNIIADDPQGEGLATRRARNEGAEYTDMDWEVYPDGLYKLLMRLKADYPGTPIYITENGAAFPDKVVNGAVHDDRRTNYYHGHLLAAQRAITDGVPLKGYFAWSLIDNFEWAYGYSRRFGLVYVDYETQQRIPKDSAKWFAQMVRANGVTDES